MGALQLKVVELPTPLTELGEWSKARNRLKLKNGRACDGVVTVLMAKADIGMKIAKGS